MFARSIADSDELAVLAEHPLQPSSLPAICDTYWYWLRSKT
jgi:hypothetical protein